MPVRRAGDCIASAAETRMLVTEATTSASEARRQPRSNRAVGDIFCLFATVPRASGGPDERSGRNDSYTAPVEPRSSRLLRRRGACARRRSSRKSRIQAPGFRRGVVLTLGSDDRHDASSGVRLPLRYRARDAVGGILRHCIRFLSVEGTRPACGDPSVARRRRRRRARPRNCSADGLVRIRRCGNIRRPIRMDRRRRSRGSSGIGAG